MDTVHSSKFALHTLEDRRIVTLLGRELLKRGSGPFGGSPLTASKVFSLVERE